MSVCSIFCAISIWAEWLYLLFKLFVFQAYTHSQCSPAPASNPIVQSIGNLLKGDGFNPPTWHALVCQSLHLTFSMSHTDGVIWSNPIIALAPSRWWHRHRLVITVVHHTPSHFKVSPLFFLVQLHLSKGVISSHPLCLDAYYDGPVSTDPIRFLPMFMLLTSPDTIPNPDDLAHLTIYNIPMGCIVSTPSNILFKGGRFNRTPCDVSKPSLVMRSSVTDIWAVNIITTKVAYYVSTPP